MLYNKPNQIQFSNKCSNFFLKSKLVRCKSGLNIVDMKKILVSALFSFLLFQVNAQVDARKNIVGKWKVSAMEADGERFDFSNPEKFAESMYANDLRKDSTKVFTQEDSSAVAFAAAILYVIFRDMQFEFKSNGKFSMTLTAELGGEKKTEKSEGKYAIKGSAIEMTEAKKKEKQSVDFTMPDKRTLILSKFRTTDNMNLVLVKE